MSWPPFGYPFTDGVKDVQAADVNDIIAQLVLHLADASSVHGITDTDVYKRQILLHKKSRRLMS